MKSIKRRMLIKLLGAGTIATIVPSGGSAQTNTQTNRQKPGGLRYIFVVCNE